NDLQGANDFCDHFLYYDYDIQNFQYSQDLDIYNNSYNQFFRDPYNKYHEVPETCNQFQNIHYSVFANVQPPYIQDHNLQNIYNTSNAQFFHNGFDNYQKQDVWEQDVQEQDVQASRDYLLDILPLGNNGEKIYNNRQEASDVIPQVTLEHLTSIRQHCNSNSKVTTKPIKARYAKLFKLSKKVVGLALKADLSEKLSGVLNTFLHEAQDKIIASQKHDEDNESDKSDNSD
ncbi:11380_t:CDS:2, partial [Gigaspora margarita]